MSGRGGGRGRGRGGPSTGRGGMFMTGSSLMGGFSFTEVIEAGKEELKKSLFPVRSGCSGLYTYMNDVLNLSSVCAKSEARSARLARTDA